MTHTGCFKLRCFLNRFYYNPFFGGHPCPPDFFSSRFSTVACSAIIMLHTTPPLFIAALALPPS